MCIQTSWAFFMNLMDSSYMKISMHFPVTSLLSLLWGAHCTKPNSCLTNANICLFSKFGWFPWWTINPEDGVTCRLSRVRRQGATFLPHHCVSCSPCSCFDVLIPVFFDHCVLWISPAIWIYLPEGWSGFDPCLHTDRVCVNKINQRTGVLRSANACSLCWW